MSIQNNISNRIKVSVVIPTYNRKDSLAESVKSVFSQKYPKKNYEIVVADDGSNDGTKGRVLELSQNLKRKIRYFAQKNSGPAAARNLGIKKSIGEIICFIDDDCVADKNWLRELIKGYKNKEVGGVGGNILPSSVNSIIEEYVEYVGLFDQKNFIPDFLATANASYRRGLLEKIGGFDENLVTGEDRDLGIRSRIEGYALKYAEKAIVHHRHRTTLIGLIKQQYGYGRGTRQLYNKYPEKFSLKWKIACQLGRVVFRLVVLPYFSLKGIITGKRIYITKPLLDALVSITLVAGITREIIIGNKEK